MKENIKVLISEEEVNEKIKEMGEKISREYAGKELHMICVLKGGVFFISREKILQKVWNYDYFGEDRTVDTHVKTV